MTDDLLWERSLKLLEAAEQRLPHSDDEPEGRHIRLVPASSITPQPVKWLWTDRIPQGCLCLLGGREGVGKSTYAYDLTADITRGKVPGTYYGEPRPVLVAATEDSWAHTIVPRLMAAGADLTMVYRIDVVAEEGADGTLSLPADIPELAQVVHKVQAGLILLDPLLSRISAKLDTHKDAEVRVALEPLTRLAEVTDCAIIGLIHVNKSTSTDPLTMLMGSRAFAAVARAVLFVMHDPDHPGMRLLGQPKNNLGRSDLPTLRFSIENTLVASTAEGDVYTGKLVWQGESPLTLEDAIDVSARGPEDRSAVDEAGEWLRDYLLSRGGAAPSQECLRDARREGHAEATVKRARKKRHVVSESAGFPKKSYWKLGDAMIEHESQP